LTKAIYAITIASTFSNNGSGFFDVLIYRHIEMKNRLDGGIEWNNSHAMPIAIS
jgi:hypothetical protein